VEQLNDLGYFVETELTRKAKLTEEQVKELVFKMERKKEEVEVATQMYQFIDKVCYYFACFFFHFIQRELSFVSTNRVLPVLCSIVFTIS